MSTIEDIWPRYRDNSARHLIGIARDLQHRTLLHLTEGCGYSALRPSLAPLLSLVSLEDRPLGTLAARLSISPQACSQLVNLAEKAGYLERRSAPTDRRTRLVSLTDYGRALITDAVRIIREVETEYQQLVGAQGYAELIAHLSTLFHGLGLPTHRDTMSPANSSESIGVLPLISVRIQQTLMETTSKKGHVGLKMSHAQVLPLIGVDGARVHQLAQVQKVSRQAISATARDLEELGYLHRERDPLDRRGVVFRLTDHGTELIRDSVASLAALDRDLESILGKKTRLSLQDIARSLYQALHLEEEIFEARADFRIPPPSPSGRTQAERPGSERKLIELAATLKRQLGARGAERLAHLLEAAP